MYIITSGSAVETRDAHSPESSYVDSLFLFWRFFVMGKDFLTYEQQLNKLEREKGLIILDRDYAKRKLREISYYSLIGGYKEPFKHKPSGKYIRGVTFDEIVCLYYFDEEMRSLFLKYILHVERQIKSTLSYHFCEKYGESQNQYLDINNYNMSGKKSAEIHKLVKYLKEAVSLPSNYSYITHHVNEYKNVPLWVAMNAITFGNVAAMYQYVTTDIRAKISQEYERVSESELQQFIRLIANCRNVCAHSERLFTFRSKISGPDTDIHKKLKLRTKKGAFVQGKQDLFAVVIALKYMITEEEFKTFKKKLKKIIDNVNIRCPHLTKVQLLEYMGFPSNWERIAYYKK